MDACVYTGDILDKNPNIGTGYKGISLVQTNNTIYKASWYEGKKTKILGII